MYLRCFVYIVLSPNEARRSCLRNRLAKNEHVHAHGIPLLGTSRCTIAHGALIPHAFMHSLAYAYMRFMHF